jgi:hypothetical protein
LEKKALRISSSIKKMVSASEQLWKGTTPLSASTSSTPPKQIRFNAQGETPRFLTLAFRAIPGRKETLKALRPRIKDLGNSFVLTYKNGNDKARRSEVLLYQKKSQLLHPHTWGNHTYIQSFFPTTGEIVIPHEPSDCLALRFKQFDENGSLLFDTGFLDPHLYDDEQELALDLEECAFWN